MFVRFSSLVTRFSTEILLFQFTPCQMGKDEGQGMDTVHWTGGAGLTEVVVEWENKWLKLL